MGRTAGDLSDDNLTAKHAMMERSQQGRTEVWLRGARSWWGEGDESKLFWPDGYEEDGGRT